MATWHLITLIMSGMVPPCLDIMSHVQHANVDPSPKNCIGSAGTEPGARSRSDARAIRWASQKQEGTGRDYTRCSSRTIFLAPMPSSTPILLVPPVC